MATFSTEKTFTYLKNLHWKEDNDSKDGYDVICDEYLFYRVRINKNNQKKIKEERKRR